MTELQCALAECRVAPACADEMLHPPQERIPVSLLQSKIAEGRAKGIPMDRIATAVESRLRNLEHAKIALSRGAGDVVVRKQCREPGKD